MLAAPKTAVRVACTVNPPLQASYDSNHCAFAARDKVRRSITINSQAKVVVSLPGRNVSITLTSLSDTSNEYTN